VASFYAFMQDRVRVTASSLSGETFKRAGSKHFPPVLF
jgi:hypothetical protein